MPAAYSTGVSTSPVDLLQKLATWLAAQGWTIHANAAWGPDSLSWYTCVQKAAVVVKLVAATNHRIWGYDGSIWADTGYGYGIGLYACTDPTSGWNSIPDGGPTWYSESTHRCCGAGMNLPAGSVAGYHFFDDGADNIVVVVQRTPGVFTHIGWGLSTAKSSGEQSGYPYFFGSSSVRHVCDVGPYTRSLPGINVTAHAPMVHSETDYGFIWPNPGPDYCYGTGYIQVPAEVWTRRWVNNAGYDGDGHAWQGRRMRCGINQSTQSNDSLPLGGFPNHRHSRDRLTQAAFTGALLVPIHSFIVTDPGSDWAPLGCVPSIFFCKATEVGFSAGEVYQVGGVDYLLFPNFAVFKGA